MNSKTEEYLKTWIGGLNKLIGDRKEEIEQRKKDNINAVNVREDLEALVEYMQNNDIPDNVYRAINYCLDWNPHAKA